MDSSASIGKPLEEQDADVLREGNRALTGSDGTEIAGLVGADRHGRTPERAGHRNGYRMRTWGTRVGTIELAIPKVLTTEYPFGGRHVPTFGGSFCVCLCLSVAVPSVFVRGAVSEKRAPHAVLGCAPEERTMAQKDPRIDAYIAKSADFAQPVLRHLRELVHRVCPDVQETMKWSAPHFMYKGMLCGMASFKTHCTFGFWKGSLVFDDNGDRSAMGHYGRITSLDSLPSDRELTGHIRKAVKLNDEGRKVARPARGPAKPLKVPADFAAALRKSKRARAAFDAFSPSHRNEYVEWVTEAKTEATRQKRLDTAVEWIADGKSRNWKYMR
jgi:uncharacterized protein YdeI (YjbR/CyaY-like superfamily)